MALLTVALKAFFFLFKKKFNNLIFFFNEDLHMHGLQLQISLELKLPLQLLLKLLIKALTILKLQEIHKKLYYFYFFKPLKK